MTAAAPPGPFLPPAADSGAITVAVMAWNEVESLERVVRELHESLFALPAPAEGSHEVLVIDDGSQDGTAALADDLAARLPGVRVVHHPENRGLGGVYRTGLDEARGDWVTFFPADGQFPGSILAQFHPHLTTHDLLLGYIPRTDAGLTARLLSRGERVLYRLLLGPMPRFQGVFIARTTMVRGLPLVSQGRGWAIVMEIILRASRARYRVLSLPTPFRPRMAGASKVTNLRGVWTNLRQIAHLTRVLRGG